MWAKREEEKKQDRLRKRKNMSMSKDSVCPPRLPLGSQTVIHSLPRMITWLGFLSTLTRCSLKEPDLQP